MSWRFAMVLPAMMLAPAWHFEAGDEPSTKKTNIGWKKMVVDKAFRSEGVAVADFNKDSHMDIFVGDIWYEGPDFKKMHVVRRDKPYDPLNYSEAFACFAGDFNGDGWPDVIVIPFPGKPCPWYENPGAKGGPWKEHILASSACNETPIFVDLFKTGKKVLVMGWQPPGSKGDQGQLCYFTPGADPTKLWDRRPISEPSKPGKEIPGTRQFSHGLGHGDVNGDGRIDIITTGGWWEQPEKLDGTPWKFHPANLGPDCADMFVFDLDGDGKSDIISSSAHNYGFWWHQQKEGKDSPKFARQDLFLSPPELAKAPKDHAFTKEEDIVYAGMTKALKAQFRAGFRPNAVLCQEARKFAETWAKTMKDTNPKKVEGYPGKVLANLRGVLLAGKFEDYGQFAEVVAQKHLRNPGLEVGVGIAVGEDKRTYYAIMIGAAGAFSLPGQTHALHFVDINGDGLKDLVTGRRWWAHGPKGDADPGDPAVLYWFEAKKNKNGSTEFIPHLIDDDSGIGTQFQIIDMNGDGLLDIVISNKHGVFVFFQTRTKD